MSEVNIYKGISEKRKQQMKEYNRKHREQCRIAQRKYYENHKDYYKSFNRNRFKEQQHEIERLNNIINAIKEELKQKQEYYRYRKDNRYRTFLSNVLDKIKELENGNK